MSVSVTQMSLHQTFLHYTPPGVLDSVNIVQPQAATSTAASTTPAGGAIIAKGDWTKDLVHLAKTAELKSVFPSRSCLLLYLIFFFKKARANTAAAYGPYFECSCEFRTKVESYSRFTRTTESVLKPQYLSSSNEKKILVFYNPGSRVNARDC